MYPQFLGAIHPLVVKCDFMFAGTTGIVDYSNYDDMKYAVCLSFHSVDSLPAAQANLI